MNDRKKTYCKTKQEIENIDIPKLREFLLKEKENFFDKKGNEAWCIKDLELFPDCKVDRNHIVFYDEYFLCDVYANEMWLCKHTKKKHTLKTKRKVDLVPIALVIEDCRQLGAIWNGCWLIPNIKAMEVKG